MKVLVTGGCGYVGSRLIPLLLAVGHRVTCFDTQWFGEGSMPDNEHLTIIKGDVREIADWQNQDAMIHLASISQNEMYNVDPVLAESVNRWLPSIPVERLIYASSVAAYGTSSDLLTEDSPLKPTTPYGRDKALCEEGVLSVGGTVVRAASVCGYSSNMRFDTPLNSMTRDALNGRKIRVNGGKQSRCHIHIDDLCVFYVLLLNTPKEKIAGQAFNVVGESVTIENTARIVAHVTGGDIERNPASDDRSYRVAGAKALSVLGWTPRRIHIDQAIWGMKANSNNPQFKDFSPARMRML